MPTDDDDAHAFFHAAFDPDAVSERAAADSSDSEAKRLVGLPRLLRYAVLARDDLGDAVCRRLVAEIEELCPGLPPAAAWAAMLDPATGLALAAELDRLAVVRDLPLLRSLGDCVRLLSLKLPCDADHLAAFRRVTSAMIQAFDRIAPSLDLEIVDQVE